VVERKKATSNPSHVKPTYGHTSTLTWLQVAGVRAFNALSTMPNFTLVSSGA
jgi:hypothetical protein